MPSLSISNMPQAQSLSIRGTSGADVGRPWLVHICQHRFHQSYTQEHQCRRAPMFISDMDSTAELSHVLKSCDATNVINGAPEKVQSHLTKSSEIPRSPLRRPARKTNRPLVYMVQIVRVLSYHYLRRVYYLPRKERGDYVNNTTKSSAIIAHHRHRAIGHLFCKGASSFVGCFPHPSSATPPFTKHCALYTSLVFFCPQRDLWSWTQAFD
jgi:hypothetical protein